MKKFEVGDEVLVKMTVTGRGDEHDVTLTWNYHTNEGERFSNAGWIAKDLIVENLGKPQPEEPLGLGAVVQSRCDEDVRLFVRANSSPDWPWIAAERGLTGPFAWGYIVGPPEIKRVVTVLSEGVPA